MPQYEVKFAVAAVHEIETSLNKYMGDFGFHDTKVHLPQPKASMVLEADRPLTDDERAEIMKFYNDALQKEDNRFACVGVELVQGG